MTLVDPPTIETLDMEYLTSEEAFPIFSQGQKSITLQAEVSKLDEEKRMAFGWAVVIEQDGQTVTDRQSDTMTADELEKMAYRYVIECRMGGVMHERQGEAPRTAGTLCESIVFTPDKQQALGIDLGRVGWWIGVRVDDPAVWERVKSGELRAFSIHGFGVRSKIGE